MNIQELIEHLPKVELAGITAHKEMSFTDRNFESPLNAVPSAVTIILFEQNQKILFPLIKRTAKSRHHKQQIALPGGKLDKGESIEACAMREIEEEIGVNAQYIKIIRQLTKLYIPVSNHLVYPVIGYCTQAPTLKYNPDEVEKIILCETEDLLNFEKTSSRVKLTNDWFIEAPCFIYKDEIIWGATALILNEFRYLLKQIHPID